MKTLNAVVGVVVMAVVLSLFVCAQAVEAQSLLDELKGDESLLKDSDSSADDSAPQAPSHADTVLAQAAVMKYQLVTTPANPVTPAPVPVAQPVTPLPTPIVQPVTPPPARREVAADHHPNDPLLAGKAFTVTESYDYIYDRYNSGSKSWERKLALMDVKVEADLAHADGKVTQKYLAEYADKAFTTFREMTITDIKRDSAGREIKETVTRYYDAARTTPGVVTITDTQRDASGAVIGKSISRSYYDGNAKPIFVRSHVLKDIVSDASGRMLSATIYNYADEARTQLVDVRKIKNTYTGSSDQPSTQKVRTYDSADMSDSHLLQAQEITNFYNNDSQKIVFSYDSSGKLIFKDTYKGDELISHEVPSAEIEAPTAPTIRAGAEAINSDLDGTLSVQSTIAAQAEQVQKAGATIAPGVVTDKQALKDAV